MQLNIGKQGSTSGPGRRRLAPVVALLLCALLSLAVSSALGDAAANRAHSPGANQATSPAASSLAAAWRAQMQQQQLQASSGSSAARQLPLRPVPAQQFDCDQELQDSSNGSQLAMASQQQGQDKIPNLNPNNADSKITDILKHFFREGCYDKRVRPNYYGPPAVINVSFHIIGISSVSEVQMDFTTDFYFRQKWFDPRLKFRPVGEIDKLVVGAEFAEKIWLPDTFFANEKTAAFHKATTENTFIRVKSDGQVYRSIRLTVTCSCPMNLQYFPMDRQRCRIEIESYGYETKDIDYCWEKGNKSVSLDDKIELPQFKVLGFKIGQKVESVPASGNYTRLHCEIHFVRSMGYYLIQIYIPSSLIVIISWVSFWLHRNATPARVALGVTTVLTMTTLMSSTNAALPKISYIKSIDVFLGTCFVMVFASLLEYASVGYIGKRIAMKRKYLMDLKQMQQHHQKVCVAAAASAAAAAAAARQANPVGVAANLYDATGKSIASGNNAKQLLVLQQEKQIRGGTSKTASTTTQRPILMRRLTEVANDLLGANGQQATSPNSDKAHSQAHLRNRVVGQASALNGHNTLPGQLLTHKPPTQQPVQEPADPSAVVISKAAADQSGEGDVRICGLTPSDIDKYSRVVFPICFVCFNLMYWIIYGHISQQIDDDGLPLIPFKRKET